MVVYRIYFILCIIDYFLNGEGFFFFLILLLFYVLDKSKNLVVL